MIDGVVEVGLDATVMGGQTPPEPQTLDPKHLRRHPIPVRAEFLWAEDADYIVALIRSDLDIE